MMKQIMAIFQPAAEDIPRSKPSQPELRMKQLLSSQYENQHGIQSTMLYGLSEDGVVYKYQHSTGGWVGAIFYEGSARCICKATQTSANNQTRRE